MNVEKLRKEIALAKERLNKAHSILAELSKVMADSRRILAETRASQKKAQSSDPNYSDSGFFLSGSARLTQTDALEKRRAVERDV